MSNRGVAKASMSELRARVARLTLAEADIWQRIESRSSRLVPTTVSGHDLVRDRLFWVLARLSAQRHAAVDELALVSSAMPRVEGQRVALESQ
jgi:hypothetical protein